MGHLTVNHKVLCISTWSLCSILITGGPISAKSLEAITLADAVLILVQPLTKWTCSGLEIVHAAFFSQDFFFGATFFCFSKDSSWWLRGGFHENVD